MTDPYVVVGYEINRYEGGFVVKRQSSPWGEVVADFEGCSDEARDRAQVLADLLNRLEEPYFPLQ